MGQIPGRGDAERLQYLPRGGGVGGVTYTPGTPGRYLGTRRLGLYTTARAMQCAKLSELEMQAHSGLCGISA
jgi:hypothetical protein